MIDATCFSWIQLVKKTDLPSNAKHICHYLSTFMNLEHNICWPSQSRISRETGLSEPTVRKWLKYLESEGWLSIRRRAKDVDTNGGMQPQNEYKVEIPENILRGVNDLPTPTSRWVNCRSKVGKQFTPNIIYINNNNNVEEKFSDDDFALAKEMSDMITEINPGFKVPNLKKWADVIRLIRSRDKRTHDEILRLFRWANNHSFWQSNILSPQSLRKQWDRLLIQKGINTKTDDNYQDYI